MMFFSGLLVFFVLLWSMGKLFFIDTLNSYHVLGSYAAAIMFILVGIMHFAKPDKIEAMIPPPLQPYKRILNFSSGLMEIVLGMLLFFAAFRMYAAWGLMFLLVLVFPANIYVARQKPNAYNISRLFFQPIYMLWMWFFIIHLKS